MELRHLRYFVAVAEEGSLSAAAEKRLHTAQPSLSRQLRDLELEVGTKLMTRGARGVALTAAGHAFLAHSRLTLDHAKTAVEAARRAAKTAKTVFSVGVLPGQEVDWLPHVTRILRGNLAEIEFQVTSLCSSAMADALASGDLDLGFLRVEPRPGVTFRVIAKEPLVAILPSDHRLAQQETVDPLSLRGEPFIAFTDVPHVLREVVGSYLGAVGVDVTPAHYIDNFAMAISLVASTRAVALLPAYVAPLLPWSVVSRPLTGVPPTVDLALGYRADNPSAILKVFLSEADHLTSVARKESGRTIIRATSID